MCLVLVLKHRARECRGRGCRLDGKERIFCKFNVNGCCGAVSHRIAPVIDDVLRPDASDEKADTPHQSTAMNREGFLFVFIIYCSSIYF